MKFRLKTAILCLLGVLISGCVRVDIGDHVPTIGEQLIDLYEAREMGVITEAEFQRLARKMVTAL